MTNEEKQKELGLNDKQAMFCLEYLSNGCIAKEAYKSVYKPKDEKGTEANSSRLIRNDKVSQFLTFLKGQVDEKFKISKELQLAKLLKAEQLALANDGEGRINLNAYIRSIEVQNKMYGYDAPTKIEVTGKNGEPMKTESTIRVEFINAKKD